MDSFFSGKKIILGVTGGIAAYKSCLLARLLVKLGAEVRVIMTPSALEFVTPLTFSTLTGNEVIVNIFPETQKNGVSLKTWHIEYALWADLMIIAPLTVNSLAKIVHGFADNALTTVVAALRCPLVAAPAADVDMYNNKVTQENLKILKAMAYIVEPEEGFLASGLSGLGRMAEPEKILEASELVLAGFSKDLEGKNILVTAGPTYEDIDPVRFIGNRSSGKMGFQIAKAASLRGARVTLVSGPTAETAYPGIKQLKVRSAAEMKKAVDKNLSESDILVMAAAVADYRPESVAAKKIKKEENIKSIELTKTEDILGSIEKGDKKIVGFALETDNEFGNAKDKLTRKKLDMIVLNSLKDKSAGFEFDTNKVTIITKEGKIKEYPLMSKFLTANYILSEISEL
ncbi:MAG: bifunctional phosphopantothenoylcysteine decarboxylase/phosphopantothenate--cysteine ligase CoaBC [Ignavibacteria bacterium]|jgi:phosphopantothenoylcysteine decarboxylase/phosphopantothenate--cysteine ligase|nr:bifunctional phosphopantothenoylcysteine decarboxylase/phosphopantothenate--cysteine ligase CoaBC [Ignavibacteria bacterium]MCU7503619.1 bifunctional phosphopantothenoylcysteine decarboxylase/phosphopantothenate--cysteine ligase CoaBC [Ignavibacteria bacterium]MCU7516727.1 bifunctional phosphopantothenoylcysteine decarboxylase/phosphopantothenate--cysteine ligase CoaBC [Ignavibacteria bacterium]